MGKLVIEVPPGTAKLVKASFAALRPPPLCESCGVNRADPPSKLCPGCQAYEAHQR